MNTDALKDLLYRMADDALIYAHRNSEWTGLAPTLEEDIAFSSIAQDKLGHAMALYQILEQLGEADPDTTAFTRDESAMKCCHLVEIPTMDYSVALIRHFFVDTAERLRYQLLEQSSHEPLAQLARKVRGEIKYHTFHAHVWVKQLGGNGSEESKARMQSAVNETYPLALGMFEHGIDETALQTDGVFAGEDILREQWLLAVRDVLDAATLSIPDTADAIMGLGGRKGYHTEHLQPMITEMTEVFRIDPSANW